MNMNEAYCAGCGKNMTNPKTGAAFIGASLSVDVSGEPIRDRGFYQKQLGRFLLDNNGVFKAEFCWECWFNSLSGLDFHRMIKDDKGG